MTTLINTLKIALVNARKAKDSFQVTALSTLIGEAEMIGKNAGNREPTNAEVITRIRKTQDGLKEIVQTGKGDTSQAKSELLLLDSFLPKQLSKEVLELTISSLVDELGAQTIKDMGKVVKALQSRFEGQYDPGQASSIIKGILS